MDPKNTFDRRQLVKTVLIGGAIATIVLPTKWTKPLIESVVVPAHAQASPPQGTQGPPQ